MECGGIIEAVLADKEADFIINLFKITREKCPKGKMLARLDNTKSQCQNDCPFIFKWGFGDYCDNQDFIKQYMEQTAGDIIEQPSDEDKIDDTAFLAAIVDSSEDAVIGKTLEGIIMSWNYGAERIYGYSKEEVKGRSIAILIPEGYPDEVPKIFKKISRGEKIDHYETLRVRKDGKKIHVSLTISPIKDKTGTIIGASTIARDITKGKSR